MKKLRRLLLRTLLFTFAILLGLIGLQSLRFSSRQISLPAVEVLPVADRAVQRFAASVRIPTISHPDWVDSLAFEQLHAFLDSNFVDLHRELEHYRVNAFSRVYHWPGKNSQLRPILFLAHLDVVPVEESTRAEWQQPPFGGVEAEGFVWGRGTMDDKMNALGMLEAIQALLAEGYHPERSVYLAFGHDEEVGGAFGAQAIARRFRQQGIEFEYILDEGLLILEEALPGLAAPVTLIGTAEKGYLTLELQLAIEEGGHSSMPPTETAIGIMSSALHRLDTEPFPARIDGPTAELFRYVGPEMDQPYQALFANLWLFGGLLKKQLAAKPSTNATIRTTTAPTIISGGMTENLLPTRVTATVNFRILPGESMTSVTQGVRDLIADPRITVTPTESLANRDPSPVSSTSDFGFWVLQKTAREVFPHTVIAPALMVGGTDSRHYTGLAENVYRFSPVQVQHRDLPRIHGTNERLSVENYRGLIRFYAQLIRNSCK
ncbi:MAG: M20 family peptidase [Bacteroidota bacterium]